MNEAHLKQNIKTALQTFVKGNLTENSLKYFEILDYVTDRQAPMYKQN